MESQMSRGEGEMDSHFWKHFWVILLNLLFCTTLLGTMGTSLSLSLFFREDNPMSFFNLVFLEGALEEFLTLFGVDRHTVEILGWSCGGIVWVQVDDNTRSR